MNHKMKFLGACGILILLSGCSVIKPMIEPDNPYKSDSWSERRVHYSGVNQILDSEAIEDVDLVTLLDPDGVAYSNYQKRKAFAGISDTGQKKEKTAAPAPAPVPGVPEPATSASSKPCAWKEMDELPAGEKIDLALQAFYSDHYSSSQEVRRNRVQETLLTASNQRCNIYKKVLQQRQSDVNFYTGLLGTITGGMGAILNDVGSSRALAGAAGILSGSRAEFNQSYFSNLTVAVISDGIDLRRKELYDRIVEAGQSKAIAVYPVEAAIKDAILYHGQCSVITGLQEAQTSIKTTADPGMDTMNRILVKANLTKKIIDGKLSTKEDLGAMTDFQAGTISAGTTLKTAGWDNTPLAPVESSINAKDRLDLLQKQLEADIDAVKKDNKITDTGKQIAIKLLNNSPAPPTPADPNGVIVNAKKALSPCGDQAITASKAVSTAALALTLSGKDNQAAATVTLQEEQAKARAVIERIKLTFSAIERGLNDFSDEFKAIKEKSAQTADIEIKAPDSFGTISKLAEEPLCK